MILRFRAVMAFVGLLLLSGTAAQGGGLRDYLTGNRTLSTADARMLADLSEYYRMHANVRLGPEQRLDNGVAWRLLIDARTGAAVPRLTWMPDRKSLLKANALFDSAHGEALVGYDIQDVERRRQELYEWYGGKPPSVTRPPYFTPKVVAVTYATARLVSYVEVVEQRPEFGSLQVDVRGRVLDLQRGQIVELDVCRDSIDGWRDFRLGEWLEVCGDAAYDGFMALWETKMRSAIARARARGATLSEEAGNVPETLKRFSERVALYLTPTGLAVVDKTWGGLRTFNGITVNPVILPYRELLPFMKSGPWSDELLKR